MKKKKEISPEEIMKMIEDATMFLRPIVMDAEHEIQNGKRNIYGTYLKVLSEFDDPMQRGITAMGLLAGGANPFGVGIAMGFCDLNTKN